MSKEDFVRFSEICKDDIPLLPQFGYRENFQPSFKMDFHRHNVLEIMYAIHHGFEVEFLAENSKNTRIVVPEQHYIFINSGVYHRLKILENDVSIINIEFPIGQDCPISAHLKQLYNISESFRSFAELDRDFYILKSHSKSRTLLEEMLSVLSRFTRFANVGNYRLSEKSLEDFLLLQQYTLQFFLHSSKIFHSETSSADIKHITSAIQYISDYIFDDDLSSKKIADHLHLNPAYLSSIFKKHMNTNIVSYINQHRISHAMSLLENTSIPIIDIGIHIGFNNRQHFTRTFKLYANCSPSEYRNKTKLNTIKNYEGDEAYSSERIKTINHKSM